MQYFMRLLLCGLLLKAAPGKAMWSDDDRDRNDSICSEARAYIAVVDSISRTDSFYHSLNGIRTHFFYSTAGGRLMAFHYTWTERKSAGRFDENTNRFYLRDHALYYASEAIITHVDADQIAWQSESVFEKGNEIATMSLGHGKTESGDWDSEKELQRLYRQALAVIQQYRRVHAIQRPR